MTPHDFAAGRARLGLSQAALATRWGVSLNTIQRLEDPRNGTVKPLYARLMELETEKEPQR